MTPAELVCWLRRCSSGYDPLDRYTKAADLIERAYPGPNTPGERRMGFTDDLPLLLPGEPPPGHVRVRVAVAVTQDNYHAAFAVDPDTPSEEADRQARGHFSSVCTHRCILVGDVPPCQKIPEVPANVEEVAP